MSGREAKPLRVLLSRRRGSPEATAWTPSVGHHDGITVAVMSDGGAHRNPRRTAALRDDIVAGLTAAETEHLVIDVTAIESKERRTERLTKEGWELVVITSNNIAYFKRQIRKPSSRQKA